MAKSSIDTTKSKKNIEQMGLFLDINKDYEGIRIAHKDPLIYEIDNFFSGIYIIVWKYTMYLLL